MLEGWYCRSIANNNADAEEDDDEDSPEEEVPNYKDQYRNLKRKLKFLIYVRKEFICYLLSYPRYLCSGSKNVSCRRRMNVFKKLYAPRNGSY